VFRKGDTVVHPEHGAAVIEELCVREFLGEKRRYFKLRVSYGDLTLMVPTDNTEEVGLRDVRTARNHGIPVDALRNTNYPENVEQLRAVAKTIIDSRKIASRKPKTEKHDSKKKTEIKRKTPTTSNKKSTRKKTSE